MKRPGATPVFFFHLISRLLTSATNEHTCEGELIDYRRYLFPIKESRGGFLVTSFCQDPLEHQQSRGLLKNR